MQSVILKPSSYPYQWTERRSEPDSDNNNNNNNEEMKMVVVMIKRTSMVFRPSRSTKNSLIRMALATCGGAESMNSSNSNDDVKMNYNDSSLVILLALT